MSDVADGSVSGWIMPLLRAAGIPTGAAALLVLGAAGADRILRRMSESQRIDGEDTRVERQRLSSDQAAFRQSLMSQIEGQSKVIDALQADLQAASSRAADADRRVVEFQLTIARMAASLISSGVALPAEALSQAGNVASVTRLQGVGPTL